MAKFSWVVLVGHSVVFFALLKIDAAASLSLSLHGLVFLVPIVLCSGPVAH